MIAGVPRELRPGEQRVALTPEGVSSLGRQGVRVVVERGAGEAAGFTDADYEGQGATITGDRDQLFRDASILCQVNTHAAAPATHSDLPRLAPDKVVIGMANPLGAADRVAELAERGVTAFGLELIPRITRAQRMDVLSSMALIAGYRAAVLAAARLPRCLPMFMTAAGTLQPARVFVIGAGVAGLQACATAKRLGALVRAYDVRPQVKEQVASVGATFVELALDTAKSEDAGGYATEQEESFLARQRELMMSIVKQSDIVISTAAIPGKPAPVLITREMVEAMSAGSVIVDLAAPGGGNCELTRADEEVVHQGTTILGPTNIASEVAQHASELYSRNMVAFLGLLVTDEALAIDQDDEIVAGTLLCRGGEIVHPRIRAAITERASC